LINAVPSLAANVHKNFNHISCSDQPNNHDIFKLLLR
jgi:hypothetical protein